MKFDPLTLTGSYLIEPEAHVDERLRFNQV